MIPGIIASAGSGATLAPPSDTYNDYVVALLHFDGTDGDTTTTDDFGRSWPLVGAGTELDSAQAVFGSTSVRIPGTSGRYVHTLEDSDFGFWIHDFTIEFWVRVTSFPQSVCILLDTRSGDPQLRPTIYVTNTGVLRYYRNGADVITSSSGTIALDTTYHIALSRQAGTSRLFVDGVQVGSDYADGLLERSARVIVGANGVTPSDTFKLDGWVDELRITKGVGRYGAGGFTVPTEAFQFVPGAYLGDQWDNTNKGPGVTITEEGHLLVRPIAGNDSPDYDNGSVSLRSHDTGRYYAELTQWRDGGNWSSWGGIIPEATDMTANVGEPATAYFVNLSLGTGTIRISRAGVAANVLTAQPSASVLGVAVDFDAGKIWFRINGANNWLKADNTLAAFDESTPTATFTPNTEWRLYGSSPFSSTWIYRNVGPVFVLTPPAGFDYW